jgi:hypothetical protein
LPSSSPITRITGTGATQRCGPAHLLRNQVIKKAASSLTARHQALRPRSRSSAVVHAGLQRALAKTQESR